MGMAASSAANGRVRTLKKHKNKAFSPQKQKLSTLNFLLSTFIRTFARFLDKLP
jgi:hypothetical protein